MVADSRDPVSASTAYDRDALEEAYGPLAVHRDTFTVSDEKYGRMQTDATADAIGGARVLVSRGDGDQTLLVSNRGEDGWDVPGGAREPGETPEETARREIREEIGLSVDLCSVFQAYDWGFVPESETGDRIGGLWVYFGGVVGDGDMTVQDAELTDAQWFTSPPETVDRPAAPIVRAFLHD